MMFKRVRRPEPYAVTPRKVAAYNRRLVRERDALPLLADFVAADQLTAEAEMQRRAVIYDAATMERRAWLAGRWRLVRARYFALPAHIRRAIDLSWRRYGGPKDAVNLSSMLWRVAAEHGASPSDFPHLSAEDRRRMTAELNDRARLDDRTTRCSRSFSPQTLAWLSPGWEPSELYPAPQLHLTTSQTRFMELWNAIATYDAFGHNSDPARDRSTGVFEIGGAAFRFQIHYLRPKSSEPSPTPWNADLARRVIFVKVEGELADLDRRADHG